MPHTPEDSGLRGRGPTTIARALAKVVDDSREVAVSYCRGRDVPCPSCAYPMRDTPDGVCPECGWTLEVGVLRCNEYERGKLWVMCVWPVAIGVSIALRIVFDVLGSNTPWISEPWLVTAFVATALALFAHGVLGLGALMWGRRGRGRPFRGPHRWLRIGLGLLALLCVLLALM